MTTIPFEAKRIVTLVPGTRVFPWQKERPDWTREKSLLRTALCAMPNTEIRVFPWKGSNSMRGRAKASMDLTKFLQEGLADNATARHFVIAHSHGGNVALHAICGGGLERAIHGVVCMATPFLHVRRHPGADFGKSVLALLYLVTPIAGAALFFMVITLLITIGPSLMFPSWDSQEPNWWETLLIKAAVALLFFTAGIVGMKLFGVNRLLSENIGRRVDQCCKENSWPERIRTRLLIIRTIADEASGLLIAMQFSNWAFRLLSTVAHRPADLLARFRSSKVARSLWLLLGAIWVVSLPVIFRSAVLTRVENEPYSSGLIFRAILSSIAGWLILLLLGLSIPTLISLIIWAFLLIPSLIGPPFWLVSVIVSWPFGGDVFWYSPWLEISVEATHPGDWSVNLLTVSSEQTGLRHSVYDDPRTISQIAEWLAANSSLDLE